MSLLIEFIASDMLHFNILVQRSRRLIGKIVAQPYASSTYFTHNFT